MSVYTAVCYLCTSAPLVTSLVKLSEYYSSSVCRCTSVCSCVVLVYVSYLLHLFCLQVYVYTLFGLHAVVLCSSRQVFCLLQLYCLYLYVTLCLVFCFASPTVVLSAAVHVRVNRKFYCIRLHLVSSFVSRARVLYVAASVDCLHIYSSTFCCCRNVLHNEWRNQT